MHASRQCVFDYLQRLVEKNCRDSLLINAATVPCYARTDRKGVDGYLRAQIADNQQYRCGVCGHLFCGGFHIDHRMPVHLGGASDRANLWALCLTCHGIKTALENSARVQLRRQCNSILKGQSKKLITKHSAKCSICNAIYSTFFQHKCAAACVSHHVYLQDETRHNCLAKTPVSPHSGSACCNT